MKCEVCGYDRFKDLFKTRDMDPRSYHVSGELYSLKKCVKCGFCFTEPKPTKKDLESYYSSDYYTTRISLFRKAMTFFVKKYMVSKLPILKKRKGKILDVGCGEGIFLEVAKSHGWDAYGTEYSKVAKKDKIFVGELKDAKFKKEYFDVVTLWQVLEHVSYPNEILKEVNAILKKWGLLFIALPNINSLQFKIAKKKSFNLDIPRHISHFSPETLRRILEKNKFEISGISHYALEYNPFGFLQTLFNLTGCEFNFIFNVFKRGVIRKESLKKLRFYYTIIATIILIIPLAVVSLIAAYIASFFGYGDTINVYARKV